MHLFSFLSTIAWYILSALLILLPKYTAFGAVTRNTRRYTSISTRMPKTSWSQAAAGCLSTETGTTHNQISAIAQRFAKVRLRDHNGFCVSIFNYWTTIQCIVFRSFFSFLLFWFFCLADLVIMAHVQRNYKRLSIVCWLYWNVWTIRCIKLQ